MKLLFIPLGMLFFVLLLKTFPIHPAGTMAYAAYKVNECITYKNAEFHKPVYQVQIVGDKNYFISDYPYHYNYMEISFKTGNNEYTKTQCNKGQQ